MNELLEAVRAACSPKLWSVGVTLARGDRVTLESERGHEVTLRVSAPQVTKPYTVTIDLDLMGWGCDCPSREDPCAHVAAAAIAYKELKQGGRAMAASTRKRLELEVQLTRGMGVELAWVGEGVRLAPREGPLPNEHDYDASEATAQVERIARAKRIDSTLFLELLRHLDGHKRVLFEGRAVAVLRTPLLPRARVTGEGSTRSFVIEKGPSLEEVIAPGAALAGGALRILGETGLAGARWEKLPIIERFERARWAELVGELIPLMEARFPVELGAELPRRVEGVPPRIELGLTFTPRGLAIDPALVYGTPPMIRIDDKRASYLSGGVPRRDLAAERALLERLRDELDLVTGRRIELTGKDAQRTLERLAAWNDRSERVEHRFDLELRAGALEPQIDPESYEIGFSSSSGARADAAAVLDAWRGGYSMAPLIDGGFAPIPRAWLAQHGHRLLSLLAARPKDGELPAALAPDLARLAESLGAPPPPSFAALRPLLSGFEGLPSAPLPSDLSATLRSYQKLGVDWLCFLRSARLGGVLADDMGLGKTLQAIASFRGRALVVCPTSVLPNWSRELARFRPTLRASVFHGPRRALDREADVVLTTYAILRLDAALLSAERWSIAVLDEAQAIKNPDSQSARAAFGLEADFKLSLSGTPLENRLEELWSQLHFTNPGLLGARSDFEERYVRPIEGGDLERAAELRQRIKPFVLRRLKREVAPELPPRTETILYAELSEPERAIYDAVLAATRRELLERLGEDGADVLGVLEALLRLRQAACHGSLVPGQSVASSAKLEVLVDALEQVAAEGHRALVFSQWTGLLDLVEPVLARAKLPFLRLDGSTTDRAAVVERFQAADGPPVFLVSLKAGGTGLNLTAADHVYFLDPWWNPAVEDQAADRAHRIGQDKPVFIHRIVATNTVEERILALQEKKRQLAELAIGAGGSAARLTREDLLALIEP